MLLTGSAVSRYAMGMRYNLIRLEVLLYYDLGRFFYWFEGCSPTFQKILRVLSLRKPILMQELDLCSTIKMKTCLALPMRRLNQMDKRCHMEGTELILVVGVSQPYFLALRISKKQLYGNGTSGILLASICGGGVGPPGMSSSRYAAKTHICQISSIPIKT